MDGLSPFGRHPLVIVTQESFLQTVECARVPPYVKVGHCNCGVTSVNLGRFRSMDNVAPDHSPFGPYFCALFYLLWAVPELDRPPPNVGPIPLSK